MFKKGDRVVCIDDTIDSNYILPKNNYVLKKGREYIIYDIDLCKCGFMAFDVGLPMGDVDVTVCPCGFETEDGINWWGAYRFRKVEEKKEYIAVTSNVEIEEPILN